MAFDMTYQKALLFENFNRFSIMSVQKIRLTFFFILMSVTQLYAQDSLTLQQALNYALKNSQVIEKARLEIIGGQEKVKEVRAGALPQIDVTSTATYNL